MVDGRVFSKEEEKRVADVLEDLNVYCEYKHGIPRKKTSDSKDPLTDE